MKKLIYSKTVIIVILFSGSIFLSACQQDDLQIKYKTENLSVAKPKEMRFFENALRNLHNNTNSQTIKSSVFRKEIIESTLYESAKNLILSTGMSEKALNQKCKNKTEVISFALKLQAKNSNGNLKIKK